MSSQDWYAKQDVIKDLSKATGNYVDNFGGHYVVGTKPQPVWRNDRYDKDMSRFYGGQKPTQSNDMEKPDLDGITQMLRLVDNFNERTLEHDGRPKSELSNIIVSLSKLDPNVGEFVPGAEKQQNDTRENKNNIDSKLKREQMKDVWLPLHCKEIIETDNCDNNVSNNISNKQIHTSDILSDELRNMREKLKTKIPETSKVVCIKQKRERNLAIASLMKLYCKQPAEEKKPRLISPEYFINNCLGNKEKKINNQIINNTDDIVSEFNLNASTDAELIKKEIAASVEKVTKWLHSSETTEGLEYQDAIIKTCQSHNIEHTMKKHLRAPFLHLGPVTFRRKTSNNYSNCSISLHSNNSNTNKSESCIPSKHANELTEKYEQQQQQQKQQTDFWTDIENQLKQKGVFIKNQRLVLRR